MARFYGELQGGRGEATRLGHASSGLRTEACSWNGAVKVILRAENDEDIVCIQAQQHGSSRNPTGYIFEGTFEELGQLIQWWHNRDQINTVMALLGTDKLAELTGKAVR